VLFSRDDKLCTTLRDFYNRHLRDQDRPDVGYIEDQFGRELRGTGIEFLSERENWRPPDDEIWIQRFPALTIYNDGMPRAVLIIDRGISSSFGSFFTQIVILKHGISPDEIPRPNLFEIGRRPINNSGIEQWIDFGGGGSSLFPADVSYPIREIPPSADRAFPNSKPLPPLMGVSHQRLIRSGDQVLEVARSPFWGTFDNTIRRGARIDRNGVLIYSVPGSGAITDICYLEFAFTQPTK